MGQAERLHVFPWRSPPCFSSNKAHWLAVFVSCHLTPCRWTSRPPLEVQQCCVQDVLLSLSLEHNHPVTTNALLQESWEIHVLFGESWSKVYALWSKGNAKYISRPESQINYFCNCHYSSSYSSATSKPANLGKTCEEIIYFLAKLKCHICRLISHFFVLVQ